MSTILDWLTPWWAKLAVLAVLLSGLLWLKHTYDTGVAKKAVEAALVKERATTTPVIEELAKRVADRDKTVADYKAQSDALKTKIATNQGVLNATLKKLDQSSTELAMLRGSDAEFKRLLDTATANSGGATHASAIAGLERLTSAHHQCQASFREERNRHAKTLDGLEQALAVIDALQLK